MITFHAMALFNNNCVETCDIKIRENSQQINIALIKQISLFDTVKIMTKKSQLEKKKKSIFYPNILNPFVPVF